MASSRSAPRDDQLADHAVVVGGDPFTRTAVRVEPYAIAVRRVPAGDVAGRGPEVVVGILGVDPAFDGMPLQFDLRLREPKGLAKRNLELQCHEVRIADKLRDRMLDLYPGIDFDEVELVGV